MTTWLTVLRTLPLFIRIAYRLSLTEHRRELVDTLASAIGDGKLNQSEWYVIGTALGVFTPRR